MDGLNCLHRDFSTNQPQLFEAQRRVPDFTTHVTYADATVKNLKLWFLCPKNFYVKHFFLTLKWFTFITSGVKTCSGGILSTFTQYSPLMQLYFTQRQIVQFFHYLQRKFLFRIQSSPVKCISKFNDSEFESSEKCKDFLWKTSWTNSPPPPSPLKNGLAGICTLTRLKQPVFLRS